MVQLRLEIISQNPHRDAISFSDESVNLKGHLEMFIDVFDAAEVVPSDSDQQASSGEF